MSFYFNFKKLLAILALAGFLLLPSVADSQNSKEVIITDNGFQSEKIEIEVGETVTWTNDGERKHWPASDLHPTHNLYPSEEDGCIGSAFDACKGLEPGESYSFTFNEPGTWGVHDHLYPGLTMMVEVESPSAENEGPLSSFLVDARSFLSSLWSRIVGVFFDQTPPAGKLIDKGRNKQAQIISKITKEDPEKGWEYLKDAYIEDGEVIGNAHQLAHTVGNIAYDSKGLEGMKVCDKSFAYGCIHGVTERMLMINGVSAMQEVQEDCFRVFPKDKTRKWTGCIHGTGHGLLSWEGGDVKAALKHCDGLDEDYRRYCYNGVFMEYIFIVPDSKMDSWDLCTSLPERYHYSCARYYAPIFLNKGGSGAEGFDFASQKCVQASSNELRDTCLKALGFSAATHSQGDLEKIRERCGAVVSKEGRYLCRLGAADSVQFQGYENSEEVASKLCGKIPERMRVERICKTNNN